ncbi:aminopeptidase [Bacillus sp. CGMCC 1.16607]|uniref:aminopeptidase n=1 Tax=Bacillus sp. CGMCC 1.16607 TaxID=3351842 RepID=UPI0036442ED5
MTNYLEQYARLIVKTGVNLQQDQTLVIFSPIEVASFTKLVAKCAYEEGAKDVVVRWEDEELSRIKYLSAPEATLETVPEWQKEFYLSYAREGAAFVNIHASDPELMKDVDPKRIMKASKALGTAIREYRERRMNNQNRWCVVSVPTASWAKKVFPDATETEAIDRLWEVIFQSVRADKENPIAAWTEHCRNLKQRRNFFAEKKLKSLHIQNSLGTDLHVELPEGHIWLGGSEFSPDGVEFVANIPTEELFTVPKKTGVNGKVVSSMPLNHNGTLIENFSLVFKDGKVVDFHAEQGYETLKNIIETDEGASYLGELALVPYDSPISNLNILFYNTLYDENASCHLALGKAYPVCIENGDKMSKEELEQAGVNDSLAHVDFMFGTEDLKITGFTWNDEEVAVFEKGNFVI